MDIGIIIGAFGLLCALIGWIFPRTQKYNLVMQSSYQAFAVVPKEMENIGVRLMLGGRQFHRLGVTILRVWNKGRLPLRGEDVTNGITMRFADDARIIKATVERTARKGNPANIRTSTISEKRIGLTFTHLDPRDGAIIYILHTSKHRVPTVDGTIVGKDAPLEDAGNICDRRRKYPFGMLKRNKIPKALSMKDI